MPRQKGDSISLPDAYLGREQAFVKHHLLRAYLEKLFLIVGMSAERLGIKDLCYVDCFAGPWLDDSENLDSTSIAVSLRILARCQRILIDQGKNLNFRALYVEKDPAAFTRLKRYVGDYVQEGIRAETFPGDFIDLRQKILEWCGTRSFAFFFVDPTGWKEVGVKVLQPLLQRQNSEFLINFMYNDINRTVSNPGWENEMIDLLGEAVNVDDLRPVEREGLLVDTYRKNLKRSLKAPGTWLPRSAYVRVLDRAKERPKYHLVYLTTHPRGIIEFMEISEDIDLVQKRVRASTKESARAEKTRMKDLFGKDTFVDPEAGHASITEVETFWLRYLSDGVRRVGEDEFAKLLEETNWFPGDFQRALKRLIDVGKVRNLDASRKRPKKPLHWEKDGERLALTEVDK